MTSALDLSQKLIRIDTINPPGNEALCASYLGGLLKDAGFQTQYIPFEGDETRLNLIAHKGNGRGDKLPLAFSGHTDVVPLGLADWTVAPFAADVADGKLYGRGSSDMKCGVAAFVAAVLEMAPHLEGTPGVTLVITASEEDGCRGAKAMAAQGLLPKAGALIVAEPTANQVWAGHKGVLRVEGQAKGVTAHGSMPEKGVNAIYKAARAILALEALDFSANAHPVLGAPTLSVGWINGGLNVNSVPDQARFGLDVRTVPGVDGLELVERFKEAVKGEVHFEFLGEFGPIWSDPNDPWIQDMAQIVADVTGETIPIAGATFFTDAAPLKPAMGNPPTLILGPGEPEQAHQTDEYCRIDRLEQATAIYVEAIRNWCGV